MISQRGGSRTPTPEGQPTVGPTLLPPPQKKTRENETKLDHKSTAVSGTSNSFKTNFITTLLHFKSIIGDTLLPTTFFNSRSLKMFLEVDRVPLRMDKLS